MPFRLGKEIECPKCKNANVETVAFIYQSLKSNEAGKKLLLEGPIITATSKLTPPQKERLLHRLTPPKEPRKTLPAKAIALMAFLVSWLSTSAIFIARIGQKTYAITMLATTFIIATPFYLILRLVIKDFLRDIARYRKIKAVWDKQYYCRDCEDVFILKD